MNTIFSPLFRERIRIDAKLRADRKNWHFQTRKKTSKSLKPNFDNFIEGSKQFAKLQADLPAAKSFFRKLFLASVGAKATLSEIFGLEQEDGTNNDGLKLWLDSAKCELAPENGF